MHITTVLRGIQENHYFMSVLGVTEDDDAVTPLLFTVRLSTEHVKSNPSILRTRLFELVGRSIEELVIRRLIAAAVECTEIPDSYYSWSSIYLPEPIEVAFDVDRIVFSIHPVTHYTESVSPDGMYIDQTIVLYTWMDINCVVYKFQLGAHVTWY